MAMIDTNFLAKLGFVFRNDFGGDRITLSLKPRIDPATDFPSVPNTQIGWCDIDFGFVNSPLAGAFVSFGSGEQLPMPLSVNPSVNDATRLPDSTATQASEDALLGVLRFMQWVAQNPIHVTALNIRASSVQSIPTQIIILTPDISSGQMSRQIIDVASRKNAYQYQNDIITISDLDFYVGRNSSIRFEGAFSHTLPQNVSGLEGTDIPCYIDLTIDHYVSLEKGLMENVKLLGTASGELVQAAQQVQNAQAVNNPNTVTLAADAAVSQVGVQNAGLAQTLAFPTRVQSKTRR